MKKFLSILYVTIVSLSVDAQKNSKVNFNVGGELGFAASNLNLGHSIGIGACR